MNKAAQALGRLGGKVTSDAKAGVPKRRKSTFAIWMRNPSEHDANAIPTRPYSLAWADIFESNPNLSSGFRIDCYCSDCKVGHTFAAPGSVYTFISNHRNHKTRTMKLR